MSCEDLSGFYELYALGVLDGAEYDELEEHLNRNCRTCMKEIIRAVQENATVLRSVPKLDPPAELRSRVLAGFGIETRPFWLRAAPWCVAGAALAVLLIGVASQQRQKTPDILNARAVQFLNAPGVRQFSFGGQGTAPHGSVLVSREKGVMLIVGNLPAAPAGKMYETWIIPRAGAPRPTGKLVVGEDGALVGLIAGPVDPEHIKAVAVSLEPAAASPVTPTLVVFAAATE